MSGEGYGSYFGTDDVSNMRMRNISSADFNLISAEDNFDYFTPSQQRHQQTQQQVRQQTAQGQQTAQRQRTPQRQSAEKATQQKSQPKKQTPPRVSNRNKKSKKLFKKSADKKQTQQIERQGQRFATQQGTTGQAPSQQRAQAQARQQAQERQIQQQQRAQVQERQRQQQQRQAEQQPKAPEARKQAVSDSKKKKKRPPTQKRYILTKKEHKRLKREKRYYNYLTKSGKSKDAARVILAKRKRFLRKSKNFLSALLVFIFAFSLAFTYCYYEGAPIKNIVVDGKSDYDEDKIISVAEISRGQNMLTVREKQVNEKVTAKLPLISKVTLRYNFPETIELQVISTKAEIILKNGSAYTCVDQTGKVVSLKKQKLQKDQFLVTGIKYDPFKVGEYFDIKVPEKSENEDEQATLQRLSKQKEKLKLDTVKEIVSLLKVQKIYPCKIDISNLEDIQVVFDSRIRIYLGDETRLDFKIDTARDLMKANEENSDVAYVDVRYSGKNYYLPGSMER